MASKTRGDIKKSIIVLWKHLKGRQRHGSGDDFYSPPNATTCPLWTSWSSLLVMAGV